MGQLKEQFAVVMRYGFWIGIGFSVLVSLVVWYLATSSLVDERESQKQKINSAFTSVTSLQGELSTHPNPSSHEVMEEMIEERTEVVLQAWKDMYERQRGLLTWPESLQQDFIREYEDLIPIEKYIDFPPTDSQKKETYLLSRYGTYIGRVLPDIAKYARAEWVAIFDPNRTTPTRKELDQRAISGRENRPLVEWSEGSQQNLLNDLFPWRTKPYPSTLEVYYSQENLWILKQLLQIIDTVNKDANEPFEARVHEIKAIKIGRSVNFNAGSIQRVPARMLDGMGMDDMGMGMDDMGMGMDDMGMGMGGMEGVPIDPADNRYVDPLYQPITGAALRTALTSALPTDVNLAVAKKVPVMMSVAIDQRAIPDFLAACGSAALMVQVRQVRVLEKDGSVVSDSGGGGGYGGSGGYGGGYGGGMDSGGMDDYGDIEDYGGMDAYGGGGRGAMTMNGTPTERPFDMDLEVYGLINIYNPPSRESLGLDQVTEDTVVEGLNLGNSPAQPAEPPTPVPVNPATPMEPADTVPPATEAVPDAGQPAVPATPPDSPPAGQPPGQPTAGQPTAGAPTGEPIAAG